MDTIPLKKLRIIGILILYAVPCILSLASAHILENQNHLQGITTVDDEGDGDYTSIKEALNNANPGDIIEVYSGTYFEHGIEIHVENITLNGIPYELGMGNDIGKPFINGEGKDFVLGYMVTRGVLVNGFHMENAGGTSHDIVNIWKSNNCIFSNNDINNTVTALIFSQDSHDIQILNNSISNSLMRQGIAILECNSFIISDNVITDVETGILLQESDNNIIMGNSIYRCSRSGIDVHGDNNTIISNHFEDNSLGIDMFHYNNHVKRNNFIKNDIHMRFIYGSFTSIKQRLTNRWYGNYWGRPRLLPYPVPGGIFLIPTIQFDWFPAQEPYDTGG